MAAKKGKKKGKGKKGGKKSKGKSKKSKTKGKSGKKSKSPKKESKKGSKKESKRSASASRSESKSSSKSMSDPRKSKSTVIRRSDVMEDLDIEDVEVDPRKSSLPYKMSRAASGMSCMPPTTRASMPSVRVSTQKPPILIQASDQSQIIEIIPSKSCECPEEKIALLDELACPSGYASSQSSCFIPQTCQPHPPPCYFPPRCPVPSGCDSQPMQGPRPSAPPSVGHTRPRMSKLSSRASAPYGHMYASPSRQASTWGPNTFGPGERFQTNVTVMSAMDDSHERSFHSFMNSQRLAPDAKMKSRHSVGGTEMEAQRKKSKKHSKKDQEGKIRKHAKDNRKSKKKRESRREKGKHFKRVESETALFDDDSDSSSFSAISAPTSVQSLPTVSSARSSSVSNLPSVRVKPIPQYPWWNAPPPPPPMVPWWIPPYYMPPPPTGKIPMNNPYQTHSREYSTQNTEWNSSQDTPPAYKAPEIIWMLPSEPPPRDPQPYLRRADPMTPRIYVYPPRHLQEYEISSEFAGTTQEDGSFEDMYSNPFAEEYGQYNMNRSSSWPQIIPTPEPFSHYQDPMKQKVTFAPSSEHCLPSLRTVEKATSWPRTAVLRQTKRYIYPESLPSASVFHDQEWQNQEMGSNFAPQIRPNITGENRYESFSTQGEYRPMNLESFAGGHSRAYYAPQRSNIQFPQIGNRYSRESRQWQPLANQYQRGYRRQGGSFQFHGVPGRGLGPMPSYVPHVSQSQPYLQQRGNLPQSLSRVPEGQPLENNSVYSYVGYNSQNERRLPHLPWPHPQNVQLMMFSDLDNKPRMETTGQFTAKERLVQEARLIQEAHLKNDYENVIHTSYNVKRDALFNQSFANSNINQVDIKKAQISSRGYDNQRAEYLKNSELFVRLPENVSISRNVEMKLSRENHPEQMSSNIRPNAQYYEQGNYLPSLPEMNKNMDSQRISMLPENQQTCLPGVQMSNYPSMSLNTNHPLINSNEAFRSSPQLQKINVSQLQMSNAHESINRNNNSGYKYASPPMGTSEPIEQQSYHSLPPHPNNIFENRYPSEAITEDDYNMQQNTLYQEEMEPLIQESRGITSVNASTMTKTVPKKSVISQKQKKMNSSISQKSNIMVEDAKNCLNDQSIKQDGNSQCRASINNQFVRDCRAARPNNSSSFRRCSNRRTNASRCNYTRVNPKSCSNNYCDSFATGCNAMPLLSTGLVQAMVVDTRYPNANNSVLINPAPQCIEMYSGVTDHSPSRTIPRPKTYFADVYSVPTKTSGSHNADSIYQITSNYNKTVTEKLPFPIPHDFDVDRRKQNLNKQQLLTPNNSRINLLPSSHDRLEDMHESREAKSFLELRVNLTSNNPSVSNIISQGCINTNLTKLANSKRDEELGCYPEIYSSNEERTVVGKVSCVQPQIKSEPFPVDEKAANPTSQILETSQEKLPITQGTEFRKSADNKITNCCDLQNTTKKKMFGKSTKHVNLTVSRSHDNSRCPSERPTENFVPVSLKCAENHGIPNEQEHSPTSQTEANRISSAKKSGTRLPQGSSNKLLVSLNNSTMLLDRCANCQKWIRPDDEDNSVETSSAGIILNDSESQRSADTVEVRVLDIQLLQSTSSESPFQTFHEHNLSSDSSKRLMASKPPLFSTQISEITFRDSGVHHKSCQMIHQPCHRTASTEELGDVNLDDLKTSSGVLVQSQLSMQNHESSKQLHSRQMNVFPRSTTDNVSSDQTSSDVISLGTDALDEKQSKSPENLCPFLSSWAGSKRDKAKISDSHHVNNDLKLGVRDPKSISDDGKYSLLETMQYLMKGPELPLDGTPYICTCPSDPVMQDGSSENIINTKGETREHRKDMTQESLLQRSTDKISTRHDRTRSLSQSHLEEIKPSATRNVRSENVIRQ